MVPDNASNEAKPANRLKRDDFLRSPVWEWVTDTNNSETDESYVRPANLEVIPLGGFAQYLVSAVASLKDRTEIPACVAVTVQGHRIISNPEFVFLLDRQLPVVGNETERLFSRHTKHAGNRVVRWCLNVKIDGERRNRSGTVRRSMMYMLASMALKLLHKKSERMKQ